MDAIKNLLDKALALPLEERIELFESLRENLLNDPQLQLFTDEERRILDERLADHEENPGDWSPWEEVEARLLALLKDRR